MLQYIIWCATIYVWIYLNLWRRRSHSEGYWPSHGYLLLSDPRLRLLLLAINRSGLASKVHSYTVWDVLLSICPNRFAQLQESQYSYPCFRWLLHGIDRFGSLGTFRTPRLLSAKGSISQTFPNKSENKRHKITRRFQSGWLHYYESPKSTSL
jgi:hypothetical protein